MHSTTNTERSLIGVCLTNNKPLTYIVATLKPQDFIEPKYKYMFEAVVSLYNQSLAVDIVTVSDRLQKDGKLELVGGRNEVNDIALECMSTAGYKSYVKLILEASKRKQLKELAHAVLQEADDIENIDKVIVSLNANATKILTRTEQDNIPAISDGAIEVFDDLERMYESGEPLGLATPFPKLNNLLGGLQGGKLYILAARPSMGKTAMAINIAEGVAEYKNVLVFSLEMQRKELAKRIMLKKSKTNGYLLQQGRVNADIVERMTASLNDIASLNMLVEDRCPCTPSKVELGILNTINSKGSCDLVIIDYLQLMDADSKMKDRQAAISDISRKLKQLANKYNVPIIALSQLSRALESRENKRPILSDLRESGAIEQDADVVMFVYRDEMYNDDMTSKGKAEVIIAKQRDGELGKIDYIFNGSQSEFIEMKTF